MLNVTRLVKNYKNLTAVDHLSFFVGGGEILGIVGPNGAGKTTTLRCITGIIPPSSGEVSIAGFSLADEPIQAKKRLAFVPDDPRLFSYMTVWDHVLVVTRMYGAANGHEKGRQLLEKFDLWDRKNAYPGELSRGMKQKLGIILALVHDPELIVLDEPLTGLDPMAMRQMKQTIVDTAAKGVAIIVSSHMLHLIEEISHRILIINKGKKLLEGALNDIRKAILNLSEHADLEDIFIRAVSDENVT